MADTVMVGMVATGDMVTMDTVISEDSLFPHRQSGGRHPLITTGLNITMGLNTLKDMNTSATTAKTIRQSIKFGCQAITNTAGTAIMVVGEDGGCQDIGNMMTLDGSFSIFPSASLACRGIFYLT